MAISIRPDRARLIVFTEALPGLTALDLALRRLNSSGHRPAASFFDAAAARPVSYIGEFHHAQITRSPTVRSRPADLAFGMPGGMHDGPMAAKSPAHVPELDLTKEQQREMRKLMGEQMKQRQAITQRYLDKLPEAERQAMQKDLDASRKDSPEHARPAQAGTAESLR